MSEPYFFGFEQIKSHGFYWQVWPEKAILDFIYLAIPKSEPLTQDLFLQGYRFQNLESLNAKRLRDCLKRFTPPRVQQGGAILLSLMKKHD